MPPIPNPQFPIPTLPLHPGTLNLLIGHPGTGKSLLALHFAQQLLSNPSNPDSPAQDYPPLPQEKPTIAILTNENPGLPLFLHAYHIPPESVLHIPTAHRSFRLNPPLLNARGTTLRPPSSPAVDFLYQDAPTSLKLLILDPLPAYIGPIGAPATSISKQLEPLLEYAAHHHVIILGITHLQKSPRNKEPLLQLLGSLGYAAHARNILLLTKQPPSAPSSIHTSSFIIQHSVNTRYLIPIKNNLLPITHGTTFTFQPPTPQPPFTPLPNLPTLTPEQEKNLTEEQYLERRLYHEKQLHSQKLYAELQRLQALHMPPPPTIHFHPEPLTHHPMLHNQNHPNYTEPTAPEEPEPTPESQYEKSKLDFALEFLLTELKEGPIPSTLLQKNARSIGITPKTLHRARYILKTHAFKKQNQWHLKLPESTTL